MAAVLLTFTAESDAPHWPERLEAAAQALESVFPGDALRIALAAKDGVPDAAVPDRPAYFRSRMRTRRRWFALRGEKVTAAFAGATHPSDFGFLTFGGSVPAGSPACLTVQASFATATENQVERALRDVGDALGACWGSWTPRKLDAWRRVLQTGATDRQGLAALTPAGLALPRLAPLAVRDPLQPEAGAWWNYWSARTCARLGVDPGTEADWRDIARPTPAGAWLVKLGTDAPEEITPDAMERLAWLHRRVPALGARA